MGSLNVTRLRGKRQKANYFHHLLRDIEALEMMIHEGIIEKNPIRIGAEQELFITKNIHSPAFNAMELLRRVNDPHYTTEIGKFNLEINSDPLELASGCFLEMHSQLNQLINKLKVTAAGMDTSILLTGILPTLNPSHLDIKNMTPVERYAVLNQAVLKTRGEDFNIHIKGLDEVNLLHDTLMLESCNTSWQMHLQIDPDEFVGLFNWAQMISAPLLAITANSPLLFGKELWHETRIALFSQSVDLRANSYHLNDNQPRVSFEENWQTGTIADIYKDNLARFRSLVSSDFDEDSVKAVQNGIIPKLRALNLQNGTVYRWNRACYGVGGGKPHLRIENRYIPSGPTVIDEMANMALWVGLMKGKNEEYNEIHKTIDFKEIKSNFYRAARYGMYSQFDWKGKMYTAKALLSELLLPMARSGLHRCGISSDEIEKYLQVIENRIIHHNGSEWMIRSYRNLQKIMKRESALEVLTIEMLKYQEEELPVSHWPVLKASNFHSLYQEKKVKHVMSTDIFTVEGKDPLEWVVNLMFWKNIHHMPVVNKKNKLLGLITWTDVLKYKENRDSIKYSVNQMMKKRIVTIDSESTVEKAKTIMEKHNFNCLPVVNNGILLGIITSKDW
ncbi:MAG TPA: glutamate-cysteine ligase family protein [Saprospiraceae bacterium]|nr:glutamate-cysteine ligase family protein [Saprospiraceae bacterium]